MTDLEKVIARHRDRVRVEYERTQRQKLPQLHGRMVRSVRRRRIVRCTAGTLLGISLAVCVSVLFTLPPASGRVGGASTLASGGSVAVDPSSETGFWPYVGKDLSEHVCTSSVLEGPQTAAVGFAESMLGWRNVVVIGTNQYGNHASATIGELPTTFTGGALPPHPVIDLYLERLRSENCWWVTGISDPDDAASFSATVEDGDLYVSFDLLPGAERAEVVVVEERSNVRRYLDVDAGDTRAHLTGFRGPGAVIVLWKGASGSVFSAAGVILPVGDSSRQTR